MCDTSLAGFLGATCYSLKGDQPSLRHTPYTRYANEGIKTPLAMLFFTKSHPLPFSCDLALQLVAAVGLKLQLDSRYNPGLNNTSPSHKSKTSSDCVPVKMLNFKVMGLHYPARGGTATPPEKPIVQTLRITKTL